MFEFSKETKKNILEVKLVQEGIERLCDTTVSIGHAQFKVSHKLQLTMLDGKACQAVTETSSKSASCTICGATPSMMNDFGSAVVYGMSTLRAWSASFTSLIV